MIFSNEDIITAIATPAGEGAISVVRVSGKGCIENADKIFCGKDLLQNAKTHTIHYGNIISGNGETIDDVLISVFKKPNSYTGEDSVEISSHGNPLVTEKIVNELINTGVRLSEPGEFTKRAFLNGKIDLAQAEAVADVISSRTEASLRGARNQLDGLLSSKVEKFRSDLINISSKVELELDFAEEEMEFISKQEIAAHLNGIKRELAELQKTYRFGRIIKDGVNVAIVGKPNVGKSSLMNYILKESRAIVSEIPGTTRDVIREDVSIDGMLYKVFDTAGIRLTEDAIEKEGVYRSRETVKNADIILFLDDNETGFSEDLYKQLLTLNSEERILHVINKSDLFPQKEDGGLFVSAKTGDGIERLFSEIKRMTFGSENYSEKTAVVSNSRHFNSLKKASESLGDGIISAESNLSGEFIAADLRNAADALGEIIGIVTTDDILNNIFSNFCIGK